MPKEVTIAVSNPVDTLDPDRMQTISPLNVAHLLFGNLTAFTPDGKGVVPGLADSWKLTDDDMTLTFTLKPDLVFSDGASLTAEDVEATFKRYLSDETNINAGALAPISSVSAADPVTVVFQLAAPYPSLPLVLAQPGYGIFPGDRVSASDFFEAPVSAGPYELDSLSEDGREAVLSRNASYHGATPLVETIRFVVVPDQNARVAQLTSGQVDIAAELQPSLAPQLTGDVRPVFTQQFFGLYLYVNNRVAPLNDPRVRKAISAAIDRDKINTVTFAGKSRALDDIFPSTMSAHAPSLDPDRDVDAAKALLKGTACEYGCSLSLMQQANGQDAYSKPGVVIQANLADIGIDLKVDQVDSSVASDRAFKGDFELSVGGLYDYADIPDGFLVYGLQSDGGINALYSGYSNADMDAAVKKAITSDGPERDAALEKVHLLFARDLPYIPLLDVPQMIGSRLPSDTIVYPAQNSFFEVGSE